MALFRKKCFKDWRSLVSPEKTIRSTPPEFDTCFCIFQQVVAVVVVLALGLGLGLGLRSKSDNIAGNQGENKATEQTTTSTPTQVVSQTL